MQNSQIIDQIIVAQGASLVSSPDNEAHAVARGKKQVGGKPTNEEAVVFLMEPGAKRRFRQRASEIGKIPSVLSLQNEKVKTDIVEVPRAQAQLKPPRQTFQRPFMTGLEISGLGLGTVGTAGLLARLPGWGDVLFSNWHVVSNFRQVDDDPLGRKITQPFSFTGGEYIIGEVIAYAKPRMYQTGDAWSLESLDRADFAVIKLLPGGEPAPEEGRLLYSGVSADQLIDQMFGELNNDIRNFWDTLLPQGAEFVGFPHYHRMYNNRIADDSSGVLQYRNFPRGLGKVDVGDKVWMSSRTLGLTHGVVRYVNLIGGVDYGVGEGWFRDMFMIDPDPDYGEVAFSAPGASGSAILDYDGPYCVGNGFAGASGWMWANCIQDCLTAVLSSEQLAVLRVSRE